MDLCCYTIWGNFPDDLRDLIAHGAKDGWAKSRSWNDLQKCIANELKQQLQHTTVLENIPLSRLGVPGSWAEIDIVLGDLLDEKLSGFLIHVSGHKQPRHEKELLEIMAVSLANRKFKHGILIVCSDNKLRLEGRATSYAYCSGPLLRLVEPIMQRCNLLGLLIIGLPSPSQSAH